MRDDFHGDDLRTIWQNQPTEASTMTLEKIRQKARELHAKTRRELLGTLTVPLVVALFYAFGIKQFPPLQQVLQPLFAFALAWSLAGLYFLNRGKWSGAMPGDSGFSAGLELCRREIERRRDYFRHVLLWSFGPVLLVIGTFILALAIVAGRGIFPNAMPFIMLVVVWIAAYFVIRVRKQRELQREIDELNDIERENSL
ncbi:MAG: hypothetical protein ACR2NN_16810 [Bryobacteraceae bacterium]